MPFRICLVALNALSAIDPTVPGPIGGMETRAWSLARGLARQPDVSVSLLVRHGSSLRHTRIEGVELHLLRDRLYRHRESIALRLQRLPHFPWFGLKSPRWSDLIWLPAVVLQRLRTGKVNPLSPLPQLKDIPADLFLTFGVQQVSARVIAAAHASGCRCALFLAHDSDLDPRILTDPDFVSPAGDSGMVCRWILTHADVIFCQTPSQQQNVRQFGREAILFRNPIDLDHWFPTSAGESTAPPVHTAGLQRYALWIGRADRHHKQPLTLIELARQCPQVEFLMVMNSRDDSVEREVRASAPPNVHIVEQIPFGDMPAVMRQAAILVNTSPSEGFPNTFLQAAACGVPIASLFVEAEFLKASRAGWCAHGNVPALANVIRDCWEGRTDAADRQAAREFIATHHSLQRQAGELLSLLTTHPASST